MGLLSALAICGAALVIGAGIAFICDELSQDEIRRQDELKSEYNNYEKKKRAEYRNTCRYYENLRNDADDKYSEAISEYTIELIKQRKIENQATFDKIVKMYNEQYEEKKKLLDECHNIVTLGEKSIETQQNSYVRFKSIKSTLISLQEAIYKLEAYLKYLKNYKAKLDNTFDSSGEILEPFSMTLPKDYPYEGKLYLLKKDSFDNHRLIWESTGSINLSTSDYELFDSYDNNTTLPFMVQISSKGYQFLSLTKGLLKNSIGGTIGIDAEVSEVSRNTIKLHYLGNQYLPIKILRSDLLNQQRRTPVGSNLHVYIKDYDFALKKTIWVSEKMSDGLSIAQFDKIALLQTNEERKELYDYLKENDLLDEDDEWRISPIRNDDKELMGIIMQIGHSYAFKAFFEKISDDNLVLRYGGMLPQEELLSFDDVFVTTNVTVDCYSPNQVQNNLQQYENYFEECQKLQMYLIGEFTLQYSMMANSPTSVYINQWTEITNRLVELLSYGSHIKISVLEWKYLHLQDAGKYTILFIDEPEKIIQFVKEEEEKNRRRFFIELQGEETCKIQCDIIENDDEIKLRLHDIIDNNTLIDNNFVLDMYSVAFPYAENQHAHAFSMFKEGRVVNEEIKTAIINTSEMLYKDNGYRINELFNKKIQTNEKQLDAVTRAFGEERFFLIQGPPGTGKTTVIKELILQQLNRSPKSRILVVSQANVAVDNVLRGISEISKISEHIEDTQIVRCGSQDKIADDIEYFSFDKKYEQYLHNLKNKPPKDEEVFGLRKKWLDIVNNKDNNSLIGECLLSCYQIIGATCVGLESRHYGLNNMEFDLVIIDEAGKALAGELLIPINHAKKVIIIGDHKQLPPVINTALYKGGDLKYDDIVEEDQQVDFLNRSFFQRLYENCPNNLKCMLNVQFRMPPVIANLVNMFYDGELKTGSNCYSKIPMFCNSHLLFVDMKDEPDYKENDKKSNGTSASPYNDKEVEAAIAIATKIRKYYKGRIVIITPYKKQKYNLIKRFKASDCENVCINTIDAFQGDEENVVIYCTTRSVKPTRYFSDSARLNVAFSRSKNTLIFLGSSTYLNSYPKKHILRKVSDYLTQNAKIIQYKDWVQEDFDLQFVSSADILINTDTTNTVNETTTLPIPSSFFDEINTPCVSTQSFCQACGKELNEGENVLCEKCITKSETNMCKCCGEIIYLSFYDKYIHGDSPKELCCKCSVAICSECQKKFYIQNHKKQDLLNRSKKLLCSDCQKKFRQIVYHYPCDECGTEITLTYDRQKQLIDNGKHLPTVCFDCQKKLNEIVYRHFCDKCGTEITLTYAIKKRILMQGKNLPTICSDCKEKGNEMIRIGVCCVCHEPIFQKRYIYEKHKDTINTKMHKECSNKVYQTKKCSRCNKSFSITYGEKEYFEKKRLSLPKKCKDCRKSQ